eukprot:COSAG04_NODE_243_length_18986_cov_22.038598_5_plen_293_part_00
MQAPAEPVGTRGANSRSQQRRRADHRAAGSHMEAAAAPPQPAAAAPPLPFLGDDIFVLIAAELDARMLGRLACAAQRFWRASVRDPMHMAEDAEAAELWSVVEEGARRRLCAQGEQVRGWVSRGGVGGSWLRALGEAEKLQRPLCFTAHHEQVDVYEGHIAVNEWDYWRSAACGHEMRRGRHYATFTLRHSVAVRRGGGAVPNLALLGVVGASFDPTDGCACNSPQGWLMYTRDGTLANHSRTCRWEGQPEGQEEVGLRWGASMRALFEGDVVVGLPPPLLAARCGSRVDVV